MIMSKAWTRYVDLSSWRTGLPRIVFVVLLLIYAGRLCASESYRSQINIDSLERIYASSQYVLGWDNARKAGVIMSDQDIYALAGWRYVHGANPASINPEHPPLGKYLIGLSILLFSNQNLMSGVFGFLCLVLVFPLSTIILRREWLAIIATALLSMDKQMFSLAQSSMLDIYSLFFVIASLLAFMKATRDRRAWVAFGVVFGLGVATKYLVAIVLPIALSYLVIRRKYGLIPYALVSSLASLGLYTLTYAVYFSSGHSVANFLALELSVVTRWNSVLRLVPNAPSFVVWSILYTGRDPYYRVGPFDWSPLWPVIASLSILATFLFAIRSEPGNGHPLIAMLWFWWYLGFLSQGVVFERYLLSFLPAMYILTTWFVHQVLCLLVTSARSITWITVAIRRYL